MPPTGREELRGAGMNGGASGGGPEREDREPAHSTDTYSTPGSSASTSNTMRPGGERKEGMGVIVSTESARGRDRGAMVWGGDRARGRGAGEPRTALEEGASGESGNMSMLPRCPLCVVMLAGPPEDDREWGNSTDGCNDCGNSMEWGMEWREGCCEEGTEGRRLTAD